MDRFKWIKEHFSIRHENVWNHISDIVPNIFDEYYLIHWKVGIVDNFPFNDYPEQNKTIEQTNLSIKIEREFGLFLNSNKEKLFREISLKDISNTFKKPYDYKILNEIKQTPAIEILKRESESALKNSINKFSNGKLLNLFVEDIFRFPTDDNPKQDYSEISVEKYLELQERYDFDYCSYLFPNDLSWCLTTSEDLPMFLCIKKDLKDKFQDDFILESFKVEYEAELY